MIKKTVMLVSTLVALFASTASHAGIVINGTRIIYPEKSGEISVQLSNKGASPLLVQAWIDDGDASANPSTSKVPFVLTPPVVRIDPTQAHLLRILSISDNLPKDRESLFWFNVVEIPPKPNNLQADVAGMLQMSFRTRIKLFYRPTDLQMTPSEAHDQLQFQMNDKGPAGKTVQVKNPSPYYLTINKLEVKNSAGTSVHAKLKDTNQKIIPPFGILEVPFPELKSITDSQSKIIYTLINDSGGSTQGERPLLI